MFKRLLLVAMFLPFVIVGFAAQLTATLQSGDKLTPFYGNTAFKEAMAAAVDGDIITLSAGSFTTVEINKSVSVYGVYAFSETGALITQMNSLLISADNVTLEGIRFTSTLTIKGTDQLHINRCYITKLDNDGTGGKRYHTNTIVTDCLVINFCAMPLSENAVVRNSNIQYFSGTNDIDKMALIEHCNISLFLTYNDAYYHSQPNAIYRNCYLGFYTYNVKDINYTPSYKPSFPLEFHDNKIMKVHQGTNGTLYCKSWDINLSSCVAEGNLIDGIYSRTDNCSELRINSFANNIRNGIVYGPKDHKEYPSIPIINSSSISTNTDADGVLHVRISASARD